MSCGCEMGSGPEEWVGGLKKYYSTVALNRRFTSGVATIYAWFNSFFSRLKVVDFFFFSDTSARHLPWKSTAVGCLAYFNYLPRKADFVRFRGQLSYVGEMLSVDIDTQ